MLEYTFAMIKPDAVAAKNTGKIIDMIEHHGFEIMRMHKVLLTEDIAKAFYGIHQSKPFFGELVEFITSGPVIIMALSKQGAVTAFRDLMGATDSKKAAQGTLRNLFGTDIAHNAVHGSDSDDNAKLELSTFFADEMDEEEECTEGFTEEEYDDDDDEE